MKNSEKKIRTVLADALYGSTEFLDGVSAIFGCKVQTISQVKSNQNILLRGKKVRIDDYFSKHPGVKQKIKIRGGKEVTATIGGARLHLCAHNKKRFIVAIKYEGEEEYRYLVASHLSWRTLDIVVAYTLSLNAY